MRERECEDAGIYQGAMYPMLCSDEVRRFREALAVALELFELAPRECTCTAKWICPHCLLKAALTRIEALFEEKAP